MQAPFSAQLRLLPRIRCQPADMQLQGTAAPKSAAKLCPKPASRGHDWDQEHLSVAALLRRPGAYQVDSIKGSHFPHMYAGDV